MRGPLNEELHVVRVEVGTGHSPRAFELTEEIRSVEKIHTPWGKASQCTLIDTGFLEVSCPKDAGGFMLSEHFARSNLSVHARKRLRTYQRYTVAGYNDQVGRAILAWELPQYEIALLAGD